MANPTSVSAKIDEYAKLYMTDLREQEQTKGSVTKLDVANRMLQEGKLTQSDYENFMSTNEALQLTADQQRELRTCSAFTFGQKSYLDSLCVTDLVTGWIYKDVPYTEENAAEISSQQQENIKKSVEKAANGGEVTLEQEIGLAPKVTYEDVMKRIESHELTPEEETKTVKELEEAIEQQKEAIEESKMTHEERKEKFAEKMWKAYNDKDLGGFLGTFLEYNGYMTSYMDEKSHITDLKNAVKDAITITQSFGRFSSSDELIEYVNQLADDGDDSSISIGEAGWEILKGLGDAVDSLIGTQGLEFAGLLGAAQKLCTLGGTAGKIGSAIIQTYFGTEGTILIAEGAADIAEGVETNSKEQIRQGGSEAGMGAVMVTGAAKSLKGGVRAGYIKRAKNNELVQEYELEIKAKGNGSADIKAELENRGYVVKDGAALEGAEPYMSKANNVQAYRFNPNGTPEEIVANNPGVFVKDGKYYIPNKWNPDAPYEIDFTKDQMIMIYGEGDMAVCDGGIFKGSYVDRAGFESNGQKNYVDPSSVEYGKVIDVTKQAPGAFKVLPEGTKVATLEGEAEVKAGQVVALDHEGNPYVTTVSNILKRNEGLSTEALTKLRQVDQKAFDNYIIAKDGGQTLANYKNQLIESVPENLRAEANDLVTERTVEKVKLDETTGTYTVKPSYGIKSGTQFIETSVAKGGYGVDRDIVPPFWSDIDCLKTDILAQHGIEITRVNDPVTDNYKFPGWQNRITYSQNGKIFDIQLEEYQIGSFLDEKIMAISNSQ